MARLSADNVRVIREDGDPPDTLILCGMIVGEQGQATVSPMVLVGKTREERLLEIARRIDEWARTLKDFCRQHPERLNL